MLCFLAAATVCVLIAIFSARLIEEVSKEEIRRAWIENDLGWAEIEADGLQLFIFGDDGMSVFGHFRMTLSVLGVEPSSFFPGTNRFFKVLGESSGRKL